MLAIVWTRPSTAGPPVGASRSGAFARGSAFCHTKKRSLKNFPSGPLRAAANLSSEVPRTYEERSKRAQVASETSGSLKAIPVSLVAAGNVNSGQLAIGGSGALSAAWSGGLTPIVASNRHLCRLHLALGRGSEVLSSYGGRHPFASVDCWLRYHPSPGVRRSWGWTTEASTEG